MLVFSLLPVYILIMSLVYVYSFVIFLIYVLVDLLLIKHRTKSTKIFCSIIVSKNAITSRF